MSLSVAGVWAVGVWATTVWADGVWREGAATTIRGRRRGTRRYRLPAPFPEPLEDAYVEIRKFASAAEIREALGEHVLLGTKKLTPPSVTAIDWRALATDSQSLGKYYELYERYVEDERDVEMLLLGGM